VTPNQVQQIEFICSEVGKILARLLQTPSVKGQQIVLHISKERCDVWIEKPPEMVHIRIDSQD